MTAKTLSSGGVSEVVNNEVGPPVLSPEDYRGAGIYCIHCLSNRKSYVGQARAVGRRLRYHRARLRNGQHWNSHLQQAWALYGEAAFSFRLVEAVSDESCLGIRERYWIEQLGAANRISGFNLTYGGEGGRPTEETLAKVCAAAKLRGASEDFRLKVSLSWTPERRQAQAEKTRACSGDNYPAERRAKMSRIALARPPISEETRQKMSQVRLGRKASIETRQKMSQAQLRRYAPDSRV